MVAGSSKPTDCSAVGDWGLPLSTSSKLLNQFHLQKHATITMKTSTVRARVSAMVLKCAIINSTGGK